MSASDAAQVLSSHMTDEMRENLRNMSASDFKAGVSSMFGL